MTEGWLTLDAVVEDGRSGEFLFLFHQVPEARAVVDLFDGRLGLSPEADQSALLFQGTRGVVLASNALHGIERTFNDAYDLAHGDGRGVSREKISPLDSPPRLDNSCLVHAWDQLPSTRKSSHIMFIMSIDIGNSLNNCKRKMLIINGLHPCITFLDGHFLTYA